MSESPTYQLTLRPLPDKTDPEGIRRLRRVLKHSLRSCRMRCVAAVEIPSETWQRLSGLDRVLLQRAGCKPPDDPVKMGKQTDGTQIASKADGSNGHAPSVPTYSGVINLTTHCGVKRSQTDDTSGRSPSASVDSSGRLPHFPGIVGTAPDPENLSCIGHDE